MASLIRTDFKKIFKDVLFKIIIIIGVGLSIVTILLYLGMGLLFNGIADGGLDIRTLYNANDLLLASISPLGGFGLVLSIFTCIILNKDYTQGVLRNKIICGKSRLQIFTSNVIVSIVFIVCAMLAYSVVFYGVASIFFNTKGDIYYFLESYAYIIAVYIVIALLISFCNVFMKNVGLSIVTIVALTFVLSISGTIVNAGYTLVSAMENPPFKYCVELLDILKTINIASFVDKSSSVLGSIMGGDTVVTYTSIERVVFPITCVTLAAAFYGFGYLAFSHKDLK